MNALPLASVVIPTYNRLPLLREAVQSVREQSCNRWELIVVDDGSTDDTIGFVTGLDDPRIRLLHLAHTGNVATVRNAGARAALGEYLAFLDSDDVWLTTKLETQIEHMRQAGVSWSYTRYEHIDTDGAPLPFRSGVWKELSGRILREVITTEAAVAISTLIVRRAFFQEVGGFDEDPAINFREDYDLVVRLALLGEALAVRQTLSRVREHAGRATRGLAGAAPFLTTAHVYGRLLPVLPDRTLRRLARKRRAYHLAEAGAQYLRAGSISMGTGLLLRSLVDWPFNRQWASALARGLGWKR
ncbi:MAG: glycosyltransferase family 2 protein [Longimicrobiales bacterium]